jgi:hypothetical protein
MKIAVSLLSIAKKTERLFQSHMSLILYFFKFQDPEKLSTVFVCCHTGNKALKVVSLQSLKST